MQAFFSLSIWYSILYGGSLGQVKRKNSCAGGETHFNYRDVGYLKTSELS